MFQVLQIATLFLVALALSFALAHAAELPGKMRLDRTTYLAVQTIYYPGFTVGGISEPVAILALGVLLGFTPPATAAFWWTAAALGCLLLMQAVYWLATHPVNKLWLQDQHLQGASARFFQFAAGTERLDPQQRHPWTTLRDRWEYSHLLRAVLAALGFACLAIATTTRG